MSALDGKRFQVAKNGQKMDYVRSATSSVFFNKLIQNDAKNSKMFASF